MLELKKVLPKRESITHYVAIVMSVLAIQQNFMYSKILGYDKHRLDIMNLVEQPYKIIFSLNDLSSICKKHR